VRRRANPAEWRRGWWSVTWQLRGHDLRFLVETLTHEEPTPELLDSLSGDAAALEASLEDERLFERLTMCQEAMVLVSPWLLFSTLLRRVRRDLRQEVFTLERRSRQRIPVFDTDRALALLQLPALLEYLATLLASFTRVASVTVRVPIRKGLWRRFRTNDLDVEGLMAYTQSLDASQQFEPQKRIGDTCLFLTAMFPEYLDAQYRYPVSRQLRPGARGRLLQRREDYEAYGQAFYRKAAEHPLAGVGKLDEILRTLSEDFIVAEKPIALLAERYLAFNKHEVFGL